MMAEKDLVLFVSHKVGGDDKKQDQILSSSHLGLLTYVIQVYFSFVLILETFQQTATTLQ